MHGVPRQTIFATSNLGQVRLTRVPLPESKGPCYARYVGAQQYRGETFYMQLDSHMTLVPRWCGLSQVPPKVSASEASAYILCVTEAARKLGW